MQLLPILSFAFVLIFTDKSVLGDLALAIVDGDVTLTASKNCPDRDVFKLTTAKEPIKTLARRVNGLWTAAAEGPFIGRVVHNSPSSLTLTNLYYKDRGLFVFVCNGEDITPAVDLKVLPPDITTVTEGETAVLSCYSSTADKVKWFKEGGKIRDQEVFRKEVSSKEDKASPGRFPLTLENARLEDQGVYYCNAPMAFKLIVNPKKPDQTNSPPSPHCNTTKSSNEGNEMRPREMINWVIVAVLGLAVVIVLSIFLCREKKKGRKSNASAEGGGDDREQKSEGLLGLNNLTGSRDNNHNSL